MVPEERKSPFTSQLVHAKLVYLTEFSKTEQVFISSFWTWDHGEPDLPYMNPPPMLKVPGGHWVQDCWDEEIVRYVFAGQENSQSKDSNSCGLGLGHSGEEITMRSRFLNESQAE